MIGVFLGSAIGDVQFSMLYREDGEVIPVQEKDLPVLLPVLNKNNPSPSKEEIDKWKNTICPSTGMKAVRETDTFDTFLSLLGIFCVTVTLA